ncbi:MAG: hypothetical protein WDW38_006342 [Sanguina aurantia]
MPTYDGVVIDYALGLPEGDAEVKKLCCRVLPGWDACTTDQIKITPISGGISNLLVKVDPGCESGLDPVAVKVFGAKTELIIDRKRELELLLQLNAAGFGAMVLSVFTNGRIEEFLTAKTLAPADMAHPRYITRIAAALRRFHAVPASGGVLAGPPALFATMRGWLATAGGLVFEDAAKAELITKVDFAAMGRELDELEAVAAAVASPVVFAHNDLLSGNILIIHPNPARGPEAAAAALAAADSGATEPESKEAVTDVDDSHLPLQFIDFEYSAYTYRGYDFGNHFNEFAGFDCDYTRYPDSATQTIFFSAYLAQGRAMAAAAAAAAAGAKMVRLPQRRAMTQR